MSNVLREIEERVHGYWIGAPVPDNELPKHTIVRETCELAKELGLTEAEIDEWARYQQGEPSVAVVGVTALQELVTRLRRPGGASRFRRRLERDRKQQETRT